MIDLQEIVRDTLELEPLSDSAGKLSALVAAEEIDLDEIVRTVAFDEALSVRTLRAANAVSAGSFSEITTVESAVVRLGPGWVLSLAMAASVQGQMESALPQFGLAEGDLWRHSVAASLAAEELRNFCGVRIPLEAPTSALLHDIGKLVLARHVRRHLQLGVRRAVTDHALSGLHAESQVLNINHAELGGMIARHWELPEMIASGIAHHHHPCEAPADVDPVLVHAVHVADIVGAVTVHGANRHYLSLEELQASLEVLSLPAAKLRPLSESVGVRTDEVLASYA